MPCALPASAAGESHYVPCPPGPRLHVPGQWQCTTTTRPGVSFHVSASQDAIMIIFMAMSHCRVTMYQLPLIGSMSPWVLPERTLGTVRYTETYPGNYLICRTVPCLLSTVPRQSIVSIQRRTPLSKYPGCARTNPQATMKSPPLAIYQD